MSGLVLSAESDKATGVGLNHNREGAGDLPQAKVPAFSLLYAESQGTGTPIADVMLANGYAWGGQHGKKNPNDLVTPREYVVAAQPASPPISNNNFRDAVQIVGAVASNIGPAVVNSASHAVAGVAGLATLAVTQDLDRSVKVIDALSTHLEGQIPMPQRASEGIANVVNPVAERIDAKTFPGASAALGQTVGDVAVVLGVGAASKALVGGAVARKSAIGAELKPIKELPNALTYPAIAGVGCASAIAIGNMISPTSPSLGETALGCTFGSLSSMSRKKFTPP